MLSWSALRVGKGKSMDVAIDLKTRLGRRLLLAIVLGGALVGKLRARRRFIGIVRDERILDGLDSHRPLTARF